MIEETLGFIESEEVRNYLREFLKTFGGRTEERKRLGHRRRLCSSIVCFAPAPVEQKIAVLDLIATQTKPNPEGDSCDPSKFAKEYRMALEERYNNPPGTLFRLRLCHYNDRSYHSWNDILFTEFDAAVRWIKEHFQLNDSHNAYLSDACDFLSYTIDKCVPGENDMMEEYCTWILNALGEIWYFDYGDHFKPKDWVDIIDYGGRSVEFPLPFQSGDIVTIDCCPFVDDKKHILVIGYDGFERYLAPMECLYMQPPGKILYTGSINDNTFLTESPVSGYYRIARYRGALRPYEAPLAVISAVAQSNPKLLEDISYYIQEHGNEANGIEWERIRQEFAL